VVDLPVGRRLVDTALAESPLVVLVTVLPAVLLVLAPELFVADSWLTLVAGREVVAHGLPDREALTVMALGERWVDQQWLGQLAFYGSERLGGLRLAALLDIVLVVLAFASTFVVARLRGGTTRSTLVVGFACIAVAPWAWQLRAQALALPLFVWVLALVSLDGGLRRRRTLLVFGLLVVWANVHGSVLLGAAIVSLAGLIALARRPRPWWRPVLFAIVPWGCVLASPYGADLVGYYRLLLVESPVAEVVTEWQAPKPSGYMLVFFAVAVMAVIVGVWQRRRLTLLDLGVIALTLAGSLRSTRGIVWFALAVAVLLPVALDAIIPPDRTPTNRRVSLALCAGCGALLVAALAAVVPRSDAWFSREWPAAAAAAVTRAADRAQGRKAVFPSDRHADWLLWEIPSLRGRVAYDVRFELVSAAEIRSVVLFKSERPDWLRAADGYPILVLDPTETPSRVRDLRSTPGARLLYADETIVVAVRDVRQPSG
jgi:hypothetical protein